MRERRREVGMELVDTLKVNPSSIPSHPFPSLLWFVTAVDYGSSPRNDEELHQQPLASISNLSRDWFLKEMLEEKRFLWADGLNTKSTLQGIGKGVDLVTNRL